MWWRTKKIQSIVADYLGKEGHECITVDDGVDALAVLKNNAVDLMVLDIMMPHMDGFTVCKIAREMSDLPIVILTAKQDEGDKLRGYDLGADDYITKPFSPNLLMAKIRALLKRTERGSSISQVLCGGRIALNTASREVSPLSLS